MVFIQIKVMKAIIMQMGKSDSDSKEILMDMGIMIMMEYL